MSTTNLATNTPLGIGGPEISRVGVGLWAAGGGGLPFSWGSQSDDETMAALNHAIDLGINWVDTAPAYGRGHSETVLGRWLAGVPAGDRPMVFTKCGITWDPADPFGASERTLRPESIVRECDQSLARLGVERIDLYQIHQPDPSGFPIEESWAAMAELVSAGKVAAIGVSNFGLDLLEPCREAGGLSSVQLEMSMLARDACTDVSPWCDEHGVGFLAYSPMASGLLTDSFSADRVFPDDDWRSRHPNFSHPAVGHNVALRDALTPIARSHGVSVSSVAVAWVLHQRGVSAAIVGARSPEQVDGWIAAATLGLGDDDLDRINRAIAVRDDAVPR